MQRHCHNQFSSLNFDNFKDIIICFTTHRIQSHAEKRRYRAVKIIAIEILLINHFLFQFNICGRWRCQQWCNQTNVRRRQPSTHSQTEVHDHGYPEQERRLWSQLQTRKSSCRIRGKRRDQRFNFFKVRPFTMFPPSK